MSPRWSLPIHLPAPTPTTTAMRQRLGGRTGDATAAELGLRATSGAGETRVVLSVDDAHLFVWDGANEVRRVPRAEWTIAAEPVADDAAQAVARWSALRERQFVECRGRDGAWFEAYLVEKCRFGALVAREDGSIVAVGFQAIRPASTQVQ